VIGYAPFLGQVRLARPFRMGQAPPMRYACSLAPQFPASPKRHSLGAVVPKIEVLLEHEGRQFFVRGMIDSGSDFMAAILDPGLIRSLRLVPTGTRKASTAAGIVEMKMARIDSISIGECKVANVEVQLNPQSEEERGDLDMTVGEPFLKMTHGSLDFTPEGFKFNCPSSGKFPWIPVGVGAVVVGGILYAVLS
jgi:hypothetical protein